MGPPLPAAAAVPDPSLGTPVTSALVALREGLFSVEKSQARTFPGLTNGEFSFSGSHGGVRHSCAQHGSWAKGFKAAWIHWPSYIFEKVVKEFCKTAEKIY